MNSYLRLKKSNCKNCYKCIRHCPVKSIKFSDNQATIIEEECVLCGQCFVVCPQNAKEIASELNKVKEFIKAGKTVIASIAPSFIANYNGAGIEALKKALLKLGFTLVEETAVAATIVKNQYEKIMESGKQEIIISSCCPSVNLLIQKYYPKSLNSLAKVKSPMLAHCSDIKRRFPDAKAVFIGPCVSKKAEADGSPELVDAVLTFEDLDLWFKDKDIQVEAHTDFNNESKARLFPTSGGIIKTFSESHEDYDYLVIDGMDRCIDTLKDIEKGHLSKCFIEMSACIGSCIGGPVMEKAGLNPIRNYQKVKKYAGNEDFATDAAATVNVDFEYKAIYLKQTIPDETEIQVILKKMGKTKAEDELNCGSCGYETCKEKAIAVFQKKANMTMCLPFLKEKAESFSDIIIGNTPNGVIVLDEELKVQQINKAAQRIINIRSGADVVGEPVVRILDTKDFEYVLKTGRNIQDKRMYLAEYKKYVDGSIIYDRNYHVLIYILKDVTELESNKEEKESLKSQTIEITDKVIDKQMKIVQEIAFLLGETAAETKIALTKLKESLQDE